MLWNGNRSTVNVRNKNVSHISHLSVNCSRIHHLLITCLKKNLNSFFVSPITPPEIEIVINSLNKNKSTGPHSIPIFLLKILCSYISTSLATLINSYFETGIFSDKLKLGKVNPLQRVH